VQKPKTKALKLGTVPGKTVLGSSVLYFPHLKGDYRESGSFVDI